MAYIEYSEWNTPTPSSYGGSYWYPLYPGRFSNLLFSSFVAVSPKSTTFHLYRRFTSLFGHAKRIRCTQRRAIVYLLSQEPKWTLSDDLMETISSPSKPIVPEVSLRLPSEGNNCLRDFRDVCADPRLKKVLSQLIRKSILIFRNSYYAGSLTLRRILAGLPTFGSPFWMLRRSFGSESLSSMRAIPIILDYYSYSKTITA